MFEDREGSLWVGTRAGSIAQFTDRTVSSKYGPPGVAGESIESVSEDPTGAMWFGTRLGLHRWKDGVERVITRADGLPDGRVYAIYPGKAGEIRIGTGGGLVVWKDGRIQSPFGPGAPVFSLYVDVGRNAGGRHGEAARMEAAIDGCDHVADDVGAHGYDCSAANGRRWCQA